MAERQIKSPLSRDRTRPTQSSPLAESEARLLSVLHHNNNIAAKRGAETRRTIQPESFLMKLPAGALHPPKRFPLREHRVCLPVTQWKQTSQRQCGRAVEGRPVQVCDMAPPH